MKRRTLTRQDVIGLLKKRMAGRKMADLARELNVSPQYLNDVLKGNKRPGGKILAPLGIKAHNQELYQTA